MNAPQAGIFALGTGSHAYLELQARQPDAARELVGAVASLQEPRATIGGVNFVAGFRPELWSKVAPDDVPPRVEGFNQDLIGPDGFRMPATQHDAVFWVSGSSYDIVFDAAHAALAALADLAVVSAECSGWPYRRDRDLTGFIDGSENPNLIDAPEIALVPEGEPGAGGSILLLQKWIHDRPAWESLAVGRQEQVMGRTKSESVELQAKPPDSHVARTDQDRFGKIFRRNMPHGSLNDHGTVFVGLSAEQERLKAMLESMAGLTDGVRDALTRYTRPTTGAYYFLPSTQGLGRAAAASGSPKRQA